MKVKKTPSIVTFMVLTLITSIIWVSFDIYRRFIDQTDPVVSEDILSQISPTLDMDTISQIKNKVYP